MERKQSRGFRRIFTVAFNITFMLGSVNVNDCPAGLGKWLCKVRALRRG
jgi:hypothetical protein